MISAAAREFSAVPSELLLPPTNRKSAATLRTTVEQALRGRVPSAFILPVQFAPELVSSGIAALDDSELLGGLPRGCLTEICGPASSGRTTVLFSAVAAATARQEACCLIDATDAFDPRSAVAAGVDCSRLLWVRCGRAKQESRTAKRELDRLEQALKITDMVLQAGGFGLVALDLSGIVPEQARKVPLTSWFRFRRAVERTPTVLLVLEAEANAKTCASAVVRLSAACDESPDPHLPSHAELMEKMRISAELVRAPGRKQPSSMHGDFSATPQWMRSA
jgi:hypothetical protein